MECTYAIFIRTVRIDLRKIQILIGNTTSKSCYILSLQK